MTQRGDRRRRLFRRFGDNNNETSRVLNRVHRGSVRTAMNVCCRLLAIVRDRDRVGDLGRYRGRAEDQRDGPDNDDNEAFHGNLLRQGPEGRSVC